MSGSARSLLRVMGTRDLVALLGRVRASNMVRTMSTDQSSSGSDKGGKDQSQSQFKTGVLTAAAAGGIAYAAYKSFTEEKSSFPYEVSCAEKDDCAPKKDECKKCDDSICLRRMDKEEEMIAQANQALENALKDVKPKAVAATEAALQSYCVALDAIKNYLDKAYCVINEDNIDSPYFEDAWCAVQEASVIRCEKFKDAMTKGQCAWELLCRLREVINNGKACKYTACNPLLITSEETVLCAEREVSNMKAKVDCMMTESRIVEQLGSMVEDFRRDYKAEVESLLTPNPDCQMTLTENECNMHLTHAYKKILRIQKAAQGDGCDAPPAPAC